MTLPARIPSSGSLRELGVINWAICKVIARRQQVPQAHLFTTLGRHRRLLWTWLPFAGMLLGVGKLPKRDTELTILRVGHLRGCEYELQHHRRIARRAGLDGGTQDAIFAGPAAEGLTDRQRALLTAIDELVDTRTLSDATWATISEHLDQGALIEFVTLVGQYDALAAALVTLRVPLDFPE